jgi:hypothetical protein
MNLAALREAEQQIVFYDQPAPSGESAVGLLPGTQPILISAPHSAQHWRHGQWKQEEEYTAALGYLLHQETGAHFIYGRYTLNPDPHDDDDNGSYKRRLDEFLASTPIRLVLDLHGARGDRDFGVAIGTIRGETFVPYEASLITAFEQHAFHDNPACSLDRLVTNHPRYTGGVLQPTITRYVWRQHHIPTAQIELISWVRIVERLSSSTNARNGLAPYFRGDGLRILRVYDAIRTFVNQVLQN